MSGRTKKIQFSVYETKTHLSKLLRRVIKGEELLIAHRDKVIARIVPSRTASNPRVPGSAKGKFKMSSDFDAPLPAEILKYFS